MFMPAIFLHTEQSVHRPPFGGIRRGTFVGRPPFGPLESCLQVLEVWHPSGIEEGRQGACQIGLASLIMRQPQQFDHEATGTSAAWHPQWRPTPTYSERGKELIAR